nr:hypothetical protein [Pseudomonas aeruginosa]
MRSILGATSLFHFLDYEYTISSIKATRCSAAASQTALEVRQMQVDDKKIRNAFHEFFSGVAPDNTKDRAFAYWALCDLPNGGPFYLLGNTKVVELWRSANQTSKRSNSQLIVRVQNDAAGYAQLAETLEKQVA